MGWSSIPNALFEWPYRWGLIVILIPFMLLHKIVLVIEFLPMGLKINLQRYCKIHWTSLRFAKSCRNLIDWLAGWTAAHPPPPASPPGKKISQGWAQRRRLPLVSVGLDCWTCIERRLDRDCLDVFVGWLLIPTRRGVGGLIRKLCGCAADCFYFFCVLFLVLLQTERARDKRAPIRDHYTHSFFVSTNLPQHHNLIQNCIVWTWKIKYKISYQQPFSRKSWAVGIHRLCNQFWHHCLEQIVYQ